MAEPETPAEKPQLSALEERMRSDREDLRFVAVKELCQQASAQTIALLLQAAGDSSVRVRERALEALCSLTPEDVIGQLEVLLRNDDNANLRTAALEAFPRFGSRATPFLLRLLRDEDPQIRTFTAVILGESRDAGAVEALVVRLEDEDENVTHAVAESLGKIGDPTAVPHLVKSLDATFWTQYPAVVALGEIGDPRATQPLLQKLSDPMLRQAVVQALGRCGDPDVLPALANILDDDDLSLLNEVIGAMVCIQSRVERYGANKGEGVSPLGDTVYPPKLVHRLLQSLIDPDLTVRKNAVIALGWLKEPQAVEELVALLDDYELHEHVVGALLSIGRRATAELARGLRNPDPHVRCSLLRCLGWLEDEEGLMACLPHLDDEDDEVRCHAITALRDVAYRPDVQEAMLRLLADPEEDIRNALVAVLGGSRSATLPEKLIERAASERATERATAIRILGIVRSRDAAEPLRQHLGDTSEEVRAESYRAIGAIETDVESLDILIAGLADDSAIVRIAAAESLAGTAEPRVEHGLIAMLDDLAPQVRAAAAETLGRLGSRRAIDGLVATYPTGDRNLKLSIIEALGGVKCKGSTQFLIDCLNESDADLKCCALDSLGKIGDRQAVSSVIVTLDDPTWLVRNAAIVALVRLSDERAIPHIVRRLKDPEDIVRKVAVAALGDLTAKSAVNDLLPLLQQEALILEVLAVIEKLGIPDLPRAFAFMESCNTRLKCKLLAIVGRQRDRQARMGLCQALRDNVPAVRCQAAEALGNLGDPIAATDLREVSTSDPNGEVREATQRALRTLGVRK